MAEYADHVEVGGIHDFLMADEVLGQEQEHDGRAADPGENRDAEREQRPDVSVAVEQIAGAAEPGEEDGDGREVEPGRIAVSMAMTDSVSMAEVKSVMQIEVQVRQMNVRHVQASGQERNQAEEEAGQEADEIEVRPGHKVLRTGSGAGDRRPEMRSAFFPFCTGAGAGGFRTSIRRSARPGFSRMVPSNKRHMRESLCLATVNSAWCSSRSRAKRSAPLIR